jgi:hypothetical protein
MIPYTDQFQPVTVVVRSAALARYVSFEMSLESLNVPLNTHVARSITANLAGSLNDIVRNLSTPFVWFIDDDHQFDAFIMLRLMGHDKPVVNGLTNMARPPFHCVIYRGEVESDDEKWSSTFDADAEALLASARDIRASTPEIDVEALRNFVRTAGFRRKSKKFRTWAWKDIDDKTGLFPVYACGMAGMLIKKEVFDAIPGPWFELGQTNPEEVGEDVYFCEKLRASEFAIQTPDGPCALWVDLDTVFGHTSPCTAWPVRMENGTWTIRLQWENGQNIVINRPDQPPLVLPTQEEVLASSAKSQNIVTRARELQISGLSEAAAFQQAMQEAETETV